MNLPDLYDSKLGTLLSFFFRRRQSPAVWATGAVQRPIDAAVLLAACTVLSFIPITLGTVLVHNLLTSISQSSTQIILIVLCVATVVTGRVTFGWAACGACVVAFFVAISQLIAVLHSPSTEKNYVMPSVFGAFLLAGPVAMSLARKVKIENSGRYVARIVSFLLGFFVVECITRFVFSPFLRTKIVLDLYGADALGTDGPLYRYKYSVFFADSNATGLALLCLIAMLLIFREYISNRQMLLAYVLMLGTVSRASITAAFCQFLIYKFWRHRRWVLSAIAAAAPFAIMSLFGAFVTRPESIDAIDKSFATKFLILQRMMSAYSQADTLQRLVGIGAGNAEGLIGIAAHSIVATFVLELGFLGSALVMIYVWLLSRGSTKAFYLLLVPMVVNGFSLIATSMPYFYVTLGILGVLRGTEIQPSKCERRDLATGNSLWRALRAGIRSASRAPVA
jgi:hypothetical protein